MTASLPYGTGAQTLDTGDVRTAVCAASVPRRAAGLTGMDVVRAAMARPIGGPNLEALARGKKTATLIISDHTRPVPSRDILPPMLEALRKGSPGIDITLLVATGFHRGTTEKELRHKLGDALYEAERVVVHDCDDEANLVQLGTLPSGAALVVNRRAAECELLLAEGFIEPHFFAGFSGGRKSVLPGVCDRRTVLGNHCAAFIAHPCARAGQLEGNPIEKDMAAAARMARLAYVVNVVIGADKSTALAFAGDAEAAHRAGCAALMNYCHVAPPFAGDIVVATNGGAPLDQNLYQAVKGLSAAEAAAAPGAVLVMLAECADGVGGDEFHRALRDCESPAALLRRVEAVPQSATTPDQWQYQILARILAKHRVIMVTRPQLAPTVREMKMDWAESAQAAFDEAKKARPGGTALLLPDGVAVVVNAVQKGCSA